jgi:hypothetical protein
VHQPATCRAMRPFETIKKFVKGRDKLQLLTSGSIILIYSK